ncbi:unnamed protein product [Linum trigynum]
MDMHRLSPLLRPTPPSLRLPFHIGFPGTIVVAIVFPDTIAVASVLPASTIESTAIKPPSRSDRTSSLSLFHSRRRYHSPGTLFSRFADSPTVRMHV